MRTRLHTLFTGVSVSCSLTLHVFCSQVVPKMSNQIVGLKSVQDEDDDDVADGLCPFVDWHCFVIIIVASARARSVMPGVLSSVQTLNKELLDGRMQWRQEDGEITGGRVSEAQYFTDLQEHFAKRRGKEEQNFPPLFEKKILSQEHFCEKEGQCRSQLPTHS